MSRTRFLQCLPILLAALLVSVPARAFYFPWPDSQANPRVVVYADQQINDYFNSHPEWFTRDFLILGFNIAGSSYGHTDEAIRSFANTARMLRYQNIYATSGISGTTALHDVDVTQYPANAASIEDMSIKTKFLGNWMRDPKQKVVDLSDTLSRNELERGVERLWSHVRGPVRFVDNAAIHPQVARLQAWADYCKNISMLREFGESGLHINTIFNIFARPWELTDVETKQLIQAVAGKGGNGIALPLPWSKSLNGDKNGNSWAIYRYRQLLDSGLVVIMIPSDDAPLYELYSWVATWRKRTDHIYFAVPYWEEIPF